MEKAPTFRKFIMNPINSKSTSKTRFQNLRTLLQTICLRRTKELLELPEPDHQIQRIPFTPSEQEEYENLLQRCREDIDRAVSGHRKGKVNSTILASLLRLRLFCNNGDSSAALRTNKRGFPVDADDLLTFLQQLDKNYCTYCSGMIYSIQNSVETDGGVFLSSYHHLVCQNCVPHHRAQKATCPSCVAGESLAPLAALPSNSTGTQSAGESGPGWAGQYPSKLARLLSDLRNGLAHKRYSPSSS